MPWLLLSFSSVPIKEKAAAFPWGPTRKAPFVQSQEQASPVAAAPAAPRGTPAVPHRLGRREQPFPPLSVPSLPNFLPLPGPGPSPGAAERPELSPCSSTWRALCVGGSRGSAAQRQAGPPGELCPTAVAQTGSATHRGSLGASRGRPSWDWIRFRFSFRSSPLAWGTQPCPGVQISGRVHFLL